MPQGAGHPWAKLTIGEVKAIRREYDKALASGGSIYAISKQLGAKYAVAPSTIYYVGRRKTWASLGEDDEEADA